MDETHRGPNWPDEPLHADAPIKTHADPRRVMLIAFVLALLLSWVVLLRVVH